MPHAVQSLTDGEPLYRPKPNQRKSRKFSIMGSYERYTIPLLVIENKFEVGHSWGEKLGLYLISKFLFYLVKHYINVKKVAPVGFFPLA